VDAHHVEACPCKRHDDAPTTACDLEHALSLGLRQVEIEREVVLKDERVVEPGELRDRPRLPGADENAITIRSVVSHLLERNLSHSGTRAASTPSSSTWTAC